MFDFLARFFLGVPPRVKGVHVDLVYADPNLQAFFLLLVIIGALCTAPFVSAMWNKKKHEAAAALAMVLLCAVIFAAGGIFASGFADGRHPHLQLDAVQQQASKQPD